MKRGMECSSRRRVSRKRCGQMLLMFFFFLLAFLPLMALIVDLSLVQLARREMQTAVNAAALEGLRGKGLPERLDLVTDKTERWYDKMQRRENSSKFWLEPDKAANKLEDGPYGDERFCFSLGFTTPLQWNLDNAANGDLVAGRYIRWPPDGEDYDHREGHDEEDDDYPFDRRDFTPFETESESVFFDVDERESEAFLARRRRTNRDESVPEVSSQELPVPVFFGHFWPPIEGVRENHVTVRAAAIAAARPAMMVGPAFHDMPDPITLIPDNSETPDNSDATPKPPIMGAGPFAMERQPPGWSSFQENVPYRLAERDEITEEGNAKKHWVLVHPDPDIEEIPLMRIPVTKLWAFGSPVAKDTAEELDDLCVSGREYYYYLPIFRRFDRIDLPSLPLPLVVGFGGICVRCVGGETHVTRRRFVAPHNATAIARNDLRDELRRFLDKALEDEEDEEDDFPKLSSEQRETIVRELIEEVWRRPPIRDGLLAPALVRALD